MTDNYIAHFIPDTDKVQTVYEHNLGTAELAKEICPIQELGGLAWLAGILHDSGKYLEEFQVYIKKARDDPDSVKRGSVVHSTLGGLIIEELLEGKVLAQIIQMAVFSHHGLNDSFSFETGQILIEKRKKQQKGDKEVQEKAQEVAQELYFRYIDKKVLMERVSAEIHNLKRIVEKIHTFVPSGGEQRHYGSLEFYLGMYERILMSVLIDSDRLDTAFFMQSREKTNRRTKEEMHMLWLDCCNTLEQKLDGLKSRPQVEKSRLDGCREQIADACKTAAYSGGRLFHLTVPTGGGKTLSSLRFALHRAKEHNLGHIFYVVSFNSILEQNASEIREALQRPEIILEHHCNVIHEKETDEKTYHLLTENWDSPIVVTSAVQLLNTLFSSGTASVRRMHSLCNSVIIFDEVQALPVKSMKLFNLAVNFLTEFCNSTVVLSSATQPLFERLPSERMVPGQEMAPMAHGHEKIFKRCEIKDMTREARGSFGISELVCFINKIRQEREQILVIVNTKSCAIELFQALCKSLDGETTVLYHLSTNMCPKHRQETLMNLRKTLKSKRPVLCVSTQLIEAGIDISFQCVIRSLAGLDNLIQAAGRCNRHGELESGDVYVVKMNGEAENVSRLRDISIAQDSMQWFLEQFRNRPKEYEGELTSNRAIQRFYERYLKARISEMGYEVTVNGVSTSILQMLSQNEKLWEEFKGRCNNKYLQGYPVLKQFFKTAGDCFEVIPEDGKIEMVVEYDEIAKKEIDVLQNPYSTWAAQKAAVRNLQPYTVSISEAQRRKLGSAIRPVCHGFILVLNENYYSRQTGVTEFPQGMDFLDF